jgi:hypothetical protein
MPAADPTSPASADPLELANRLYREFHGQCFWHSPRELVITAELVPFVAKGLRTDGGRRGFLLAAQLDRRRIAGSTPTEDSAECR